MLAPLQQDWPAHYFDGRTAIRHEVTVRLQAAGLEIHGFSREPLVWAYEEIRHPAEDEPDTAFRLEHGTAPETLLVEDHRFAEALRQVRPMAASPLLAGRKALRWDLVFFAGLAFLLLGSLLYFLALPAVGGLLASMCPVPWEERIGEAFANSLAPDELRCDDPAKLAVVERVLATLTAALPQSPYHYRLTLGGFGVNAFATPGGYIVVTSGLLQLTKEPEQLAGVLAHEIEHVELRHTTRTFFRELSAGLLLASLSGEIPGGTMALESAASLASFSHLRADEDAADREGMKLLQLARINPQGMLAILREFETLEGSRPSGLQYLSTHPLSRDRVAALERLAADAPSEPIDLLPDVDWSQISAPCRPRL